MKKIPLSGAHGKGLYAIVDDDDFEMLSRHSWCMDVGGGYPMTRYKTKAIRMHKMVKDAPAGLYVDHINRNKLDNRKSNLRIVTNSQNMLNTGMYLNNTSGYKGVTYSKRDKKWIAQAKLNYKNIVLGRFKDKESAIIARQRWEYANC